MSRLAIRRLMWAVLICLWGGAGTSIGTLWMSDDDLRMTPVLLVVLVLTLLTCAAAVLHSQLSQQEKQDELLGVLKQIRDGLPAADAVAAQALLRGHELARTEAEDAADLPRLSDRRR